NSPESTAFQTDDRLSRLPEASAQLAGLHRAAQPPGPAGCAERKNADARLRVVPEAASDPGPCILPVMQVSTSTGCCAERTRPRALPAPACAAEMPHRRGPDESTTRPPPRARSGRRGSRIAGCNTSESRENFLPIGIQ